MEYIVTYDKDGSRHVAHVTNAYGANRDKLTPEQMVQAHVGGTIDIVSVEVATIMVPEVSR